MTLDGLVIVYFFGGFVAVYAACMVCSIELKTTRPMVWASAIGAGLLWPLTLALGVLVSVAAFFAKLPSWVRWCFHALTKEIETEIAEETKRDVKS